MTEPARPSAEMTGGVPSREANGARIRRRRREEARFQLYGRLAVLTALAALAVLVVSIALTARTAFWQNRVTLDVTLAESAVDPSGKRDPEEIRFSGDVIGPTYEALGRVLAAGGTSPLPQRFAPDVEALVTDLATTPLLKQVVADPGLIGKTIRIRVPINDDIDLYLKGAGFKAQRMRGDAAATLILTAPDTGGAAVRIPPAPPEAAESGEPGEEPGLPAGVAPEPSAITGATVPNVAGEAEGRAIILFEGDALRNFMGQLRAEIAREIAIREQETGRLDQLVTAGTGGGTGVGTEAERLGIAARIELLRQESALLQAGIDPAASAGSNTLALGDDRPSLMIGLRGGVVKAERVSETRIEGIIVKPFTDAPALDAAVETGEYWLLTIALPQNQRKLSDATIVYAGALRDQGIIKAGFNTGFFTRADSREPELAGILAGLIGSFFTILVCMVAAAPLAIGAAIYLEEFAPKNRVTDFIEVNINNLAAVPAIVYGLLGAAVFLDFLGRRVGIPNLAPGLPLVAGLVLALRTLPTIIIASRAALKSVPPSIREAALGIGASKMQAVFHHVLPLAAPGVLTGAIIGMAGALGESAPLILIGMQAFVSQAPTGIDSGATVLPVLIYSWSDHPERAFAPLTSATIIVLLVFLVLMNGLAAFVRRRFERRW